MKKIFALVLAAAMVLALVPMTAMAATLSASNAESLKNVAATAVAGDTIELTGDIKLTESITVPSGVGLHVASGKTVKLDLAGNTLKQETTQTTGYQFILNDGNLTIDDSVGGGKISYADLGNGGEYISDTIYNRANLTINGGTIENLSSSTVATNGYPHAVDTYSGLRDTSVTVNDGTVYCKEYSAIRMFCVSATYKADLVINDGATIQGAIDMQNGTAAAALGTLTINGGTFETTKNANNVRFANWNGGATEYGIAAEIKGGEFDGTITTAYVPAAADWDKQIVSGGTFTYDLDPAYVDPDALVVGESAEDKIYVGASAEEALRNAPANSEFEVYFAEEGEELTVAPNVTINNASGNDIKVNGETVADDAATTTPDIPAANIPETGDGMGIFVFTGLALISMLGMVAMKKREEF